MLHWIEKPKRQRSSAQRWHWASEQCACPQMSSVHYKLGVLHVINAIGIYMDIRLPTQRRDKVANTGTQTVLKLWQFFLQALQLFYLEYIWLFGHPIVYPMMKQTHKKINEIPWLFKAVWLNIFKTILAYPYYRDFILLYITVGYKAILSIRKWNLYFEWFWKCMSS